MKVKDCIFRFCKKKVGDGKRRRFWEDFWIGDGPLMNRTSSLGCMG
jgi:hypothetical protein